MTIPLWLLCVLVALATPTALTLARLADRRLRARDLCLFGSLSHYRDDHSFVERFCVLGVPLRSRRGFHSTWLDG
jgi:hypothetical protein